MLRIHSFLQSIYSYMKAISKHLYRTCAIIMTGAAVIAVIAFSSHGFGGSGKNRAVVDAFIETTGSFEEKEETEADTEAEVYTEAEDNSQQIILTENTGEEIKEEQTEEETDAGLVIMTGERKIERAVTEYEYNILLHIVAAEAGGCDQKGQILVANVILNRVSDGRFPNTIEDVVYQKNQFSPVLAGTLWDTPVTDSVREAVSRALSGEDYSQGALFFSARARLGDKSMAWFDNNLRWLFAHDGHEFYTFK